MLQEGDLISLNSKHNLKIKKYMVWPLPPKHLIINYKTMQIIFGHFKNTNISTLFSFYLNLEKIIINYRRYYLL